MIRHLYFFDDLTFHLRRVVRERTGDPDREAGIARMSRAYMAELVTCMDGAHQDYTLVPWEHAVAQLAWLLRQQPERYDLIIGQGANGEWALRSLSEAYSEKSGAAAADLLENVRVARYLSDPGDPFYSAFELRTTSGPSVAERCGEIARQLPEGKVVQVAVFDDCIQTGKGTAHVIEAFRSALDRNGREAVIDTLSFIGCEATLDEFRDNGIRSMTGVLLRGETYPQSWDWDVYFLKDFFLPNALRFSDGTQMAYVDDEEWIGKIFAGDRDRATRGIQKFRDHLTDLGLLDELARI